MKRFLNILRRKRIGRSVINGEISIGRSWGNKTVFADGVAQSGGEYVAMWEHVVLRVLERKEEEVCKCLVLGIGGGTVIDVMQRKIPGVSICAVDVDPLMITVATEHFGIASGKKLHVVEKDAGEFVRRERKKHDVIVIDLFIGARNPSQTRETEFLSEVAKLATEKGTVIYNCHYDGANPKEYQEFQEACASVFQKTEEVFAYPKNRVVILQKRKRVMKYGQRFRVAKR